MIYFIAGMKFGVSKIRTSVSLALAMCSERSRRILFIDSDPAGISSEYLNWYKESYSLDNLIVEKINDDELPARLGCLSDRYDEVLVDIGLGDGLRNGMAHCNRLYVPLNSEKQSLWLMWVSSGVDKSLELALDRPDDFKAEAFFIDGCHDNEFLEAIKDSVCQSQNLDFVNEFYFESTPIQDLMLCGSDAEFKLMTNEIRAAQFEVV